jgi:hypothetical protein
MMGYYKKINAQKNDTKADETEEEKIDARLLQEKNDTGKTKIEEAKDFVTSITPKTPSVDELLEEEVAKEKKEEEGIIVEPIDKISLFNSTLFIYGYDYVSDKYIDIGDLLKNNIADIRLFSNKTYTSLEPCPKGLATNVSDELDLEGLLYCTPSSFTSQIVANGEVRLQIEECQKKNCEYNKDKLNNVIFTTGVTS